MNSYIVQPSIRTAGSA